MSDEMRRAADNARGNLVLVADDEELVRMVLSEMLEQLGYEVLLAADATEALGVFRERSNDILFVLLDYKMPGMSGAELFARLKETEPGVKVLLSSGYSATVSVDELKRQGLCGFLPKPFSLDRIRDEIARILG